MSGISTALSGYNAAVTRLDVSADNIANQASTQSTDQNGLTVNAPYVPQQVVQASIAGGAVTTSIQPVTPASVGQYDPANPASNAEGIAQVPNVDLTQQLINSAIALYSAQANLKSIKTQDQMMQQALDMIG
jgi:flagellar basal body rod protein FlgC